MKSLLDEAIKYIKSSFLVEAKVLQEMDEHLPFQLRKGATLYVASIDERHFMVLVAEDSHLLSSNNYLHLKRLHAKFDLPLIIVTTELTNDLKYISKQLRNGLIVPGRFVSMPSLMLQSEIGKNSIERLVDTESKYGIIPSYLITYYLSGYFDDGFNSLDILTLLDVSKMAFSRAVKELSSNGIVSETSIGRSSHYNFTIPRKSFWNQNRHRISPLSTGFAPVKKEKIRERKVFLSGESALSKYTLLGEPDKPFTGMCLMDKDRHMKPITPATMKGDYFFKILNILDDDEFYHHQSERISILQVFPYQPLIENNALEKTFLLFSRFNKTDIRVRSSFSELEEQVYSKLKN